ncbi:DNA-directed RNA polymerases I and III subunit RPAC2 [Meriones unguiculatus]|uniref:DNA-directed RNA polymerases I and III subunit RPAC2 n=1 Tax=Meriones unguiculatus TaxID=10047 RepID=UPI00293E8478|nr:DNA-directed RNA polymerases I and III subunit RPAC2 [Meriones unguiculatus]
MEEDQELERKAPGRRAPAAGGGERRAALELVQAAGADGRCVTFVLHDEDHTLGNALRYMLAKDPAVHFCGYTTTHPSESRINLRVQTRGALPAVEPFRRGLAGLLGLCQYVLREFETSVGDFRERTAAGGGDEPQARV